MYECECLNCGQISKQRGLKLRKGDVGCKCSTHVHVFEDGLEKKKDVVTSNVTNCYLSINLIKIILENIKTV